MNLGIIGNGVVGGCLYRWFNKQGKRVRVCDQIPDRSPNSFGDVLDFCNLIFVCIYLLDNAAGPEIEKLEDLLRLMKPRTVVVLRCTVTPGTCEALQAKFSDLTILFCPEWLTEKAAWEDFQHPWIQVIGGPEDVARAVIALLPPAPKQAIVTTRQAEWIKLAAAGFLCTKVSWFNQLYDALGVENFGAVATVLREDPRIGASHSNPFQDGYRGWGGRCFSKDTPCFTQASGMPLMLEVLDYNRELMKGAE